MITIRFCQCGSSFHQDEVSLKASSLPILQRNKFYEQVLSTGTGDYSTLDEHMILVAQWLKRHKKVNKVRLLEYCDCDTHGVEVEGMLDEEGDLPDLLHPFFTTRLNYLR